MNTGGHRHVGWLHADDIEFDARSSDKRSALKAVAGRLARRHGGSERVLFDALWERELLGSTGLGHGVALPHARLPGLAHPIGALLRLNRAVAFDAPDDKPVELVIGLLLPQRDPERQLALLAHIAGLLSDDRVRQALLQATDPSAVATMLAHGLPG
jgi:PTS system nitrogen regulatory IIA component